MTECSEVKKYIRNIASKSEFYNLIDNVILSREEKIALEIIFCFRKTLLDVSKELNVAISTARRYVVSGLMQVHKFLRSIGEL